MRSILLSLALVLATSTSILAAPHPQPVPNEYTATPQGELAIERLVAAEKAYDAVSDRWKHGQAKLDDVYQWSVRLLDAELEHTLALDSDQSLKDHVTRMHDLEASVAAQFKRGIASAADVAVASYYRVDAELRYANNRIE